MKNSFALLLAMLWCLISPSAFALAPEEQLPAEQEAQARSVFRGLRCVVCQGESIADSSADVARDMRREVRSQLAQGKTPDDIKRYFVKQYGTFVLMEPPFSANTLLLWLGPVLILTIAAWTARRYFRRHGKL